MNTLEVQEQFICFYTFIQLQDKHGPYTKSKTVQFYSASHFWSFFWIPSTPLCMLLWLQLWKPHL